MAVAVVVTSLALSTIIVQAKLMFDVVSLLILHVRLHTWAPCIFIAFAEVFHGLSAYVWE